jgi:hypothetical protein
LKLISTNYLVRVILERKPMYLFIYFEKYVFIYCVFKNYEKNIFQPTYENTRKNKAKKKKKKKIIYTAMLRKQKTKQKKKFFCFVLSGLKFAVYMIFFFFFFLLCFFLYFHKWVEIYFFQIFFHNFCHFFEGVGANFLQPELEEICVQ